MTTNNTICLLILQKTCVIYPFLQDVFLHKSTVILFISDKFDSVEQLKFVKHLLYFNLNAKIVHFSLLT